MCSTKKKSRKAKRWQTSENTNAYYESKDNNQGKKKTVIAGSKGTNTVVGRREQGTVAKKKTGKQETGNKKESPEPEQGKQTNKQLKGVWARNEETDGQRERGPRVKLTMLLLL